MSTTRRTVLTGAVVLLAAPLVIQAQQAGKSHRVCFLALTQHQGSEWEFIMGCIQ